MQGVLLILYILVVSGLIAAVGDRVGYRIGKLRLSWFNLRPRTTATLVTVVTGVTISTLTLTTLLLLNRSLVDALFNYSRNLSDLRWQVNVIQAQREAMEVSLEEVKLQRGDAQQRVAQLLQEQVGLTQQRDQITSKLAEANQQLALTQQQVSTTRQQLQTAQTRLTQVQEEVQQSRQQIQRLQTQQNRLEEAKAELAQQRDQLELTLALTQTSLTTLERQKSELTGEITRLSQVAERFRQGKVRILAGEVMASGVIEGQGSPEQLRRGLNNLLAAAEQQARRLGAQPAPQMSTAVQISKADVNQILDQVSQPGSWVIRVFSVSNRLVGEPVPIIADVTDNKLLFRAGTVLAEALVLPSQPEEKLQEEVLRLFSLANIRSREAGLLSNPLTGAVGEFSQVKLLDAVEQLQRVKSPAVIQVIASDDTFTAGPLSVELNVEVQNPPPGPLDAIPLQGDNRIPSP